MVALQWEQVHAWRLSQHGLTSRFTKQDYLQAVTHTGGIQAQVMSAAELAMCTRVERLTPREVQAATFQDHTLIKTWAMRSTLHLLSADKLPLYTAARNWQQAANWSNYFASFGLTSAQQDAFLQAVPHVLEQGPLTRPQLADAIVMHTGVTSIRDLILSTSWGSPLKPSAFRGELCFGPGQGKNVTFMNPRQWIKTWQVIEPRQALQEIARRYLQAYGPANSTDFAFWWGCTKTDAKQLFHSLKEELQEVEVEGWRAFALRATLPLMQSVQPIKAVHLLPLFDAYTIGTPRNCEPYLSATYKRHVFNLQGWTFAVVLINGSIQGIWNMSTQRAQSIIKVRLFCPSNDIIQKGIATEVERLSALKKKQILLEYEPTTSL